MKITLFGATGFSGAEVLKEALAQGHEVTAIVRNPAKVSISHQNLNVIQGSVLDEEDLRKSLRGNEAAVNCLGIGGKGDGKPNSFVSDATAKIVRVMEEEKVPRFITMSNVGAGDSMDFQPWIFKKIILPYFLAWLKPIIDDKNILEPIVMKSDLNWTIVRCPNITDKPSKGAARPTLDGKGLKLSVTNPDLAKFLVGQLTDSTFSCKAPSISN